MTEYPIVSEALAAAAKTPWWLETALDFSPFAPATQSETVVVELARPIADRVIAHLVRQFEGQNHHETLTRFYGKFMGVLDVRDLQPANSATEDYADDYDTDEPLLENRTIRAVVEAWVHHGMLVRSHQEAS